MLGTKCPSITSTWMIVPPPSAARETCSPSRAKSADNIEGASSINLGLSGKSIYAEFYHVGRGQNGDQSTSAGALSSCSLRKVGLLLASAHGCRFILRSKA